MNGFGFLDALPEERRIGCRLKANRKICAVTRNAQWHARLIPEWMLAQRLHNGVSAYLEPFEIALPSQSFEAAPAKRFKMNWPLFTWPSESVEDRA